VPALAAGSVTYVDAVPEDLFFARALA